MYIYIYTNRLPNGVVFSKVGSLHIAVKYFNDYITNTEETDFRNLDLKII